MINTNNFFKRNTSIRNPAAPYKKGKFVDQSPEYKSRVFSRVQESPLTKTLLSMRKNVLGIENALRGLFELDKKKQATDQKFDLAEKQEAKDKPKVKPKTPKIFGNIIERPKTGVLDAIKNFVTFTFLGWLFTRLQPFIDKAGGLVPLLENIMKFFSGLIVGTLNAFASFLKFGYDAKDTFDLKIKEIKKESEGIGKHFDNTLGELKAVFSGAIEVVNSFLNTSVDEEELKTARQDVPKDSPETNIPPPPKLPDVTTISPSSSAASNINGDSPIGKVGPQSVPMPTTSPTIYKVNTGGRIDPTKTPITRGVTQERRVVRKKPIIQPQKTSVGKDVGGEDKVKEIYGEKVNIAKPDFVPHSSFLGSGEKSRYSALLKSSEEYKKPNINDILGIGNLMGATVDTVLGQKPESKTYTQFVDGITYLIDHGMSNPDEFRKLNLEIMLRRIIEPKIEATLSKIREEIAKKSKFEEFDPRLSGEMQLGGEFDEAMVGAGEIDLFRRMVYAEAGNQGLTGMALVARSIINRAGLIQSGVVGPGEFNADGGSITQVITAGRGATWQYSPMGDGRIQQQLSSAQLSQASKAIELAKNPEKLIQILKNEKLSDFQISRLMASTGFRNYDRAGIDRSQQVNEINFKNHTFNTAGNRSLLVPRNVAIQLGVGQVMVGDGRGVALQETSQFGWRWGGMHNGIDLQAKSGWRDTIHLPVVVKKSGVVVSLVPPTPGANSIIAIRHPDGVITRYIHLNQLRVKMGDSIRPGQVIGRIAGEKEPGYGNSTGPHLHFEWWPDGKTPKNPRNVYMNYVSLGGKTMTSSPQTLHGPTPSQSISQSAPGGQMTQSRSPQISGRQSQFKSFREVGKAIENLKPGQTLTVKGVGKVTRDQNGKPIYHVDSKGVVQPLIFKSEFEKRMGGSSPAPSQPSSIKQPKSDSITPGKALQYREQIEKLKPGSGQTVTIPGVGWIKAGKNLLGNPVFQYFYPNTIIRMTPEEFRKRLKEKSSRTSLNIRPPSPILPEQKYPSYNDPTSQIIMARQPIIIEKLIPVSTGSGSVIAFATPSVSPNYKSQSLSRA